ncbi:hypothetical protein AN401_07145 [Zobellella denitrificans]|uniref:LITAF domain-containing protein n=1 Tax=Zobellella denitrificans TaxID=347534 RepID=A0A291HNH2_9GAMM|nr:hypothetical protein [Zobellella denitrificans]ATG73659.1 hypothetical protein AN401_07145 [Zobellella denitrificans]
MAEEKKSAYCKSCERRVVVFRKGTNHILHLLLSIITFGLWLIIWFGCAVKFGGWRCTECGSKRVQGVE